MIETLGNLGEFIGGVAVLATLIYLAVQVRQNNTIAKASSHHQGEHQFNHWTLEIAKSSELADILTRGHADPFSLKPMELTRYYLMLIPMFNTFETVYIQHLDGLASKEQWKTLEKSFIRMLAIEGVQYFVGQHPWHYDERFKNYIHDMIKNEVPKVSQNDTWPSTWFGANEAQKESE